ncbi:MAG: SDR family oxidoreductase [Planctomycetota bacterium]
MPRTLSVATGLSLRCAWASLRFISGRRRRFDLEPATTLPGCRLDRSLRSRLSPTPLGSVSPSAREQPPEPDAESESRTGGHSKRDEVARAIAFLLDPASDWITGQIIGIDGGLAKVRSRGKA